jgi:hypothetical protein
MMYGRRSPLLHAPKRCLQTSISWAGDLSQSFNYKPRVVEAPVFACSSSQEQNEVDMIWSSPRFEGRVNVLSSSVLVW